MNKRTTMVFSKDVRTQLLTKCDNVYFREAKEKKTYPYVVYDLRPYMERRMVLELDLWGTREQEMALQEMADDIEDLFDSAVFSEPYYIASFTSNNDMKNVIDENKDIKHINLSIDCIYQS